MGVPTVVGLALACAGAIAAAEVELDVDWEEFLGRSDPVWTEPPTEWYEAGFVGNGKLGALLTETMKRGAVFLCAHPVSFDRDSGIEKLEIPPDLTPGDHTTRHGMTRLPLYAYRRK